MTVEEGIEWCEASPKCAGFSAQVEDTPDACTHTSPAAVLDLHFKDPWGAKRPDTDPKHANWLVGGPRPVAGVSLWAKPLGAGQVAALFINGARTSRQAVVSLSELNLTTSATVVVTDVWSGAPAGNVIDGRWHTGEVPSLDARFVLFKAQKGAIR